MQAKKTVCFFVVLLLLSGLVTGVRATPTTVSFYGAGVTIDLAYPEEAPPAENVSHNITITADSELSLRNFTVVIKAPQNSSWQTVLTVALLNYPLSANNPVSLPYWTDILPEETNGKLSCFIYVNTSKTADIFSIDVYTTEIRKMPYSELLANYYALNNTYHQLVEDYKTLNNTYNNLRLDYEALNASYNELSGSYSILEKSYNDLLKDYNDLDSEYKELDSDFASLDSDRNDLIVDYNKLQSDYNVLNSTYYNMTDKYNSLQSFYDTLNQTYTDLLQDSKDLEERVGRSESSQTIDQIIMFVFTVAVAALVAVIIYLKWKKEQPYVVIRKETVSVKPDEKT